MCVRIQFQGFIYRYLCTDTTIKLGGIFPYYLVDSTIISFKHGWPVMMKLVTHMEWPTGYFLML